MFYRVRATFKENTAIAFLKKLKDETISAQKPDGKEIVDSMNRAVLTSEGHVQWSETCYCPTPLLHERTTVYDQHFEDFETEAIENYEEYEGRPFMEYLASLVDE